ncbi:pilus assembly protein [Pseudomaricurvus sp.]|uniref:pilus assembly protein n=1 Tax=Pseudomaricurvus sp. TaxID=2004510 RepID=UPI003F6D856F
MVQNESVNITSLNLVSDELVATIELAATKLEQFVADTNNGELLQASIEAIEQIRGTLRLIQLYGADMLADEILSVAQTITLGEEQGLDQILSVLTGSFFILPRYLEYTQQTRRSMPVLLIPYINELRQLTKKPPISESHFFQADLTAKYKPKSAGSAISVDDLSALIRRLRHMFQVGLLNVLQGKQKQSALGIMQRALERLEIISGDRSIARLWYLGATTLEVIRTNHMELNKSRKLCLTALDRQIKTLQDKGIQAFEVQPSEMMLNQLLYVIALAHKPTDKAKEALNTFAVAPLSYSDKDLMNEQEALKGPSVNTVASVAAVLKDEIRDIKEILENSSQADDKGLADYGDLAGHILKVAEILSVVGLVSAGNTLKEESAKITALRDANTPAEANDLIEIADSLLYVESTISGLGTLNLTHEKLAQANALARQEIIASSQLAEAELLVIQEAESGLALVKRALSAFAESNYDYGHIKNVGATLTSVRGGMTVLSLPRAAAVVASCVNFVDDTLLSTNKTVATQQLLETFADAVIGLEYYLDEVKENKAADDSILAIAEESLQALGYPVEQ